MNKFLFRIALLASVLLYITAPLPYDKFYCSICLLIYAYIAISIVLDDSIRFGLLNFNTMFLFSFFVCSYVYPVFLVGNDSIAGTLIENDLNTLDTVNRCVALCTLAISVYGNAYIGVREKSGLYITASEYKTTSKMKNYLKTPMVLVCLAMLLVLVKFMSTAQDVSIEVNDSPYLFQTFYFMLPLFLVCASVHYKKNSGRNQIVKILKQNKVIVVSLFLLIFLFLYIGDRAPLMTIALAFVSASSLFVKKIKTTTLFYGGFLGIILMFALRVTRGGESSISEGGLDVFVLVTQSSIMDNVSVWDILADLVCINMELNAGMDYVDKFGHLFPGANAMVTLAAPIPFLPTIFTSFFWGMMPYEVNSGAAIGDFTNSTAGNHCVIDLFMPFGVIGVVIAFYIFGYGMGKLTNGLRDNLFSKVFYIYMMSSAIFIARNSLTNIYRAVVLSYAIFFIITYFINKRKSNCNPMING